MATITAKARPFVKWAGGKTQLLSELSSLVPKSYGKYFEPFVGSGALFFYLEPEEAQVNDSNEELISCYRVIRDNVEELIADLSRHKNEEEYFYNIRGQGLEGLSAVERASRLIFLNRTCYNGLYRVNKSGQFNTPFGRYSNPKICDADNLRMVSFALKGIGLSSQDYLQAVTEAQAGDFIYFDPPYLPISKYSDFKRYTKEFFYADDHKRLATVFRELTNKGCLVMLSNSYHPDIQELYKGFRIKEAIAKRLINKNPMGRNGVKELIIMNYDESGRIIGPRNNNS